MLGKSLPGQSTETINFLARLRTEHASFGDIAMLENVRDGGKHHLAEKTLAWFIHAASNFPSAKYIAKADTDTFIVASRTLAFLKRMPGPDVPLLIGNHQWASYSSRSKNICGCCAYNREFGLDLQRRRGKPPYQCNATADVQGPFPFGIGPFFAISRSVAMWLLSSPRASSAMRDLTMDRAGGFARFAEEIYFGWVVSHVPGLRAIHLGYFGRAIHNIDEPDSLMEEKCLRLLRLNQESLSTGHFHERSNPEVTSPSSIAVHHVLTEGAMNRTWAFTWHWTRLLRTARSNKRCVYNFKDAPLTWDATFQ